MAKDRPCLALSGGVFAQTADEDPSAEKHCLGGCRGVPARRASLCLIRPAWVSFLRKLMALIRSGAKKNRNPVIKIGKAVVQIMLIGLQ